MAGMFLKCLQYTKMNGRPDFPAFFYEIWIRLKENTYYQADFLKKLRLLQSGRNFVPIYRVKVKKIRLFEVYQT